jgi:hypothetical protein
MDIESCPRTTKYGSSCHEIVKAPRSDAASAWPTCASCRTGFLLRSTFFRSATENMLTTRAPKLLLKRVEYKDRSLSQEILSCHPTDDVRAQRTTVPFAVCSFALSSTIFEFGFCLWESNGKSSISPCCKRSIPPW